VSPEPRFDGKQIFLTYGPGVGSAEEIGAAVAEVVNSVNDHHLDTIALIERIGELRSLYGCAVNITMDEPASMTFSVTRVEP
jgi:hypothetical protein